MEFKLYKLTPRTFDSHNGGFYRQFLGWKTVDPESEAFNQQIQGLLKEYDGQNMSIYPDLGVIEIFENNNEKQVGA